MDDQTPPMITLTLPGADWQLLINLVQQSMAPYQRAGEILQAMQRQASEAQAASPESRLERARDRVAPP